MIAKKIFTSFIIASKGKKMITAIKNNYFTNFTTPNKLGVSTQNKNNKVNFNYATDSVSFSGSAKAAAKLSEASTELVQKFAKELKLNKLYKIDNPTEQIRLASVANPKAPEERSLFIQYSAYSKNNSAKYLMFSVNNAGEVYESGNKLKESKDLALYENILPKLINMASKEFHMNLK